MEKLYTTQEVAEYLGFTHKTIQNYISEGRIESVKVFGSNRIKESVLKGLIKERPNRKSTLESGEV